MFAKTIYCHQTDSCTPPDMYSAPATLKYTKYSMQADVHQCIQCFKFTLPPCPVLDEPNVVSDSEFDLDSDSQSSALSTAQSPSPSRCHDEEGVDIPVPDATSLETSLMLKFYHSKLLLTIRLQ